MTAFNCVICGAWSGTEAGLYIKGYYICPRCEAVIARLRPGDPDYEIYRSGLKKIWR